jgi:hypothetical protein
MLCKVKSSLQIEDERPLLLAIPKPSLVPAKPGSTFGFKPGSVTLRSTTGVATSNHKATNASRVSSETVPDSEDDSRQEGDMDVEQEQFKADLSNNVDNGSLGTCRFLIFPHATPTYILIR